MSNRTKRVRFAGRLVKVAPRGVRTPARPSMTVTVDRSGNIVRVAR